MSSSYMMKEVLVSVNDSVYGLLKFTYKQPYEEWHLANKYFEDKSELKIQLENNLKQKIIDSLKLVSNQKALLKEKSKQIEADKRKKVLIERFGVEKSSRIIDGNIKLGDNSEMVKEAFGEPDSYHITSNGYKMWQYKKWITVVGAPNELEIKGFVFDNNKLTQIIKL